MRNLKYIILILSIAFIACEEQVIEKTDVVYDYGYFPLDTSFYKEFAVQTIVVDAPSEVYDTSNYFVRENYTNWMIDGAGDSVVRIERLFRDSIQHPWESLNVWTAKLKENKAIQTEENVKYIKIIFPLKLEMTWDGNALNSLDTLQQYPFEVISIDIPEIIENLAFDSVLTVKHKYEESLVLKWDDYEKYAYGIGLVYKQEVYLESQNIDPDIPIEERLTRGTSIFMHITAYGYE